MLITTIINKSKVLDISEIYLETGIYQPYTVQLYRRLGFEVTSAFGDYQHDASSIYMMKSLGEVSWWNGEIKNRRYFNISYLNLLFEDLI
ncbi:N-acetyltransferase [Yersinia massiliensis]|uniref:hypothetical protein n=1 Tax=Yersinia massiliensis TaxID=419257 RepID=UPI0021BDB118|nr:hypothetical protein [Yersinia massiliensis]